MTVSLGTCLLALALLFLVVAVPVGVMNLLEVGEPSRRISTSPDGRQRLWRAVTPPVVDQARQRYISGEIDVWEFEGELDYAFGLKQRPSKYEALGRINAELPCHQWVNGEFIRSFGCPHDEMAVTWPESAFRQHPPYKGMETEGEWR
jgi:hypothetical protein